MSFRDDILREQAREKKCGLGKAIRSMDPGYAKEVCEALHDPTLQTTKITQKLKDEGYAINRWQVQECRKQCDCGAIQ